MYKQFYTNMNNHILIYMSTFNPKTLGQPITLLFIANHNRFLKKGNPSLLKNSMFNLQESSFTHYNAKSFFQTFASFSKQFSKVLFGKLPYSS